MHPSIRVSYTPSPPAQGDNQSLRNESTTCIVMIKSLFNDSGYWGCLRTHFMCALQVAEQYEVVQSDAQVTSDILEGRKVQILPRATKDRKEKQVLGDLVASMGGSICANVPETACRMDQNSPIGPQTIDIVIVGSAEPQRYARELATHVRERGTEYDVISAQWLEACRMRGWISEPLPRDYKHICDLTLERLAAREDYDACAVTHIAL
jgi:hypothetical protein